MNDTRETDLFGNPVRARKGLRGRPSKELTPNDLDALEAGLTKGFTNPRLAKAVGIGLSTLKRNFGPLLATRDAAPDRLKLALAAVTIRKALAGDMAAVRMVSRMIQEDESRSAERAFIDAQQENEKSPVLGKKEQARVAAKQAELSDGWGDDLNFSGRGRSH